MPALQRSISLRGPRFYIDGDTLMFVNHLDGSTRDGPRPATVADRDAHPDAYAKGEGGADTPFKPLLTFSDPEEGRPAPEPGPHAQRRARAAEAA